VRGDEKDEVVQKAKIAALEAGIEFFMSSKCQF
jgi:hypothetical protein